MQGTQEKVLQSLQLAEIRKLAEDSSREAHQITNVLKSLKNEIDMVAESSQNVQNQFAEMFKLTGIVKQEEQLINLAMSEQTQGNTEVLAGIKNITDITHEVKRGSNEMLSGNTAISTEMSKLLDLSEDITNNTQEVISAANQIESTLKNILKVTETNKIGLDELAITLSKLRI